jgi:hypothetical protein
VLGVTSVDWYWIYVLDGWEGSAPDGQLFNDTLLRGLQVFECRYYLGGAIYICFQQYVLVPHHGVRYHLKEWKKANERPQNANSLFNLRHSSDS